MPPSILIARPRGRVQSYATAISTRPDIGGRSGEVITTLAVPRGRPCDMDMASMSESNSGS